MNDVGKQLGYLKGLAEGMKLTKPDQQKFLAALMELLETICMDIDIQGVMLDDLNDYVESIDDDLSRLEGDEDDEFDDEFDDEDELFDDDDEHSENLRVLSGNAEQRKFFDSALDEGEDMLENDTELLSLAGSVCPECGRVFFIGTDNPEDARYICPHCSSSVIPEPLTSENAPIARPVIE